MKIDSLKELEKLVRLCRKVGIDAMKVSGFEFHLAPLPAKPRKAPKGTEISDPLEKASIPTPTFGYDKLPTPQNDTQAVAERIATDGLSAEELLFYSVSDAPQDNPQ